MLAIVHTSLIFQIYSACTATHHLHFCNHLRVFVQVLPEQPSEKYHMDYAETYQIYIYAWLQQKKQTIKQLPPDATCHHRRLLVSF